MRQLCYSLFSIRVTSEVGLATKKNWEGKKKGNLKLPHPPSPPLSSFFPSLYWSPPSFVKNSRHQSSRLSLWKWPAIEPCPSPGPRTAESTERSASFGSRALAKRKKLSYCDFLLQDRRSDSEDWDKETERWVLNNAARWRHKTIHTWNYNWRKHTPTTGNKTR